MVRERAVFAGAGPGRRVDGITLLCGKHDPAVTGGPERRDAAEPDIPARQDVGPELGGEEGVLGHSLAVVDFDALLLSRGMSTFIPGAASCLDLLPSGATQKEL